MTTIANPSIDKAHKYDETKKKLLASRTPASRFRNSNLHLDQEKNSPLCRVQDHRIIERMEGQTTRKAGGTDVTRAPKTRPSGLDLVGRLQGMLFSY
jgi:hypothetical protein